MHGSSAESLQTQLRQSITNIEQQLEHLGQQPQSEPVQAGMAELRSSFSSLVRLLALGPEPEVRECPTCKHIVRRDAKLCGYCWQTLEPLPPLPEAGAAVPPGPAAPSAAH